MAIAKHLNVWYRENKRNLPWRDTKDPYLIWLSEIILQQTRVDQGMPYYFKFTENYPDIQSFAEASEDDILKLWQGLGYYSRGRNMLKTAKAIMVQYQGVFPTTYDQLIQLTGIGEYTAAAISSFAANEPKAVVDGNVYRFLARYFGVETPINTAKGKKEFQEIANNLLDIYHPGEHNQAMIEFGALQCKPKNPNCGNCPFTQNCVAYQSKKVNLLPVKLKKTKVKERFLYYFVFKENDMLLMKRRDNSDIWAGLYDFPLIETDQALNIEQLLLLEETQNLIGNGRITQVHAPVKHILTHQKIFAQFIEVDTQKAATSRNDNGIWLKIDDLQQYGQPKLIFAFINNLLN